METTVAASLETMQESQQTQEEEEEEAVAFSVAVDNAGKATEFKPFSAVKPHMLAFHLAWFSLFTCFFSTFSIPPLVPIIRDDIKLTSRDISTAGIASFAGSILSRFLMGPICDLVGPRVASATLSLLTAPVILATSLVNSAKAFIIIRFLVGLSLANFVANQFWMSCMFSGCVVGLANGVSAGWANTGSGVTQLVMPLIYSLMTHLNIRSSMAWRLAFIVPAILQAVMAIIVLLFGQDFPSGKYKRSEKPDKSQKEKFIQILIHGLKNYRGWILGIVYGSCFGVELTVDNIVARYFYDRFKVNLQAAGAIAASFGMMNFFSRPAGGMLSDEMGKRFGIRGRLWGLWMVLSMAGVLCAVLGRVNSLWSSVIVMFCFSLFVQAASGLTFGIVPFVSTRSLGVVSGITGSGGTVGAVITQFLLFSGSKHSTQDSISFMGILMIACATSVAFIYFPQEGGMFCGPSHTAD